MYRRRSCIDKTGFKANVTKIAPHVGFVHCMIHREALAAKHLQPDVNKVLEQVVTIINFIKARALNSRLFKIMCREMGSEYENLLLHTVIARKNTPTCTYLISKMKSEYFYLNGNEN